MLGVVAFLLNPGMATAGDWPQWRGPGRDAVSAEAGWRATWPEGGPKILWSRNVGVGYSAVSVAGGRLYTMGNVEGYVKTSDTVWCLDAAAGSEIWKFAYPSKTGSYPGPRSTPTVDGDAVYTLSRHGDLFCLNTKDGTVKWQKNLREAFGVKPEPHAWGLSCSPLAHGDKLILDLGKVLVLDRSTGALSAAMGDDGPGFSSPILFEVGGRQYTSSFNPFGLVLYDLSGRKEVGRHEWQTKLMANVATPIVSGDRLFISSGYGRGCALFRVAADGLHVVYENTNMGGECATGALYRDHLYGVSGEQGQPGALKCLEFATGKIKWEHGGFTVGGGIMIADGKILHLTDGGELVVADATPDAYRELARAKVLSRSCWTMPVLANGRIYCRNNKGDLVCLDVSGGKGP
jgi:outer membrane protein assembly factor BamB